MQRDRNHKIDIEHYDFSKNVFVDNAQDQQNLTLLFRGINEIRCIGKVICSDIPKRTKFYRDVHSLKSWIMQKTRFLDEWIKGKFEITIQTRCYWLLNGTKEMKYCKNPNCRKNISLTSNVVSITTGYRDYCCVKCVNNDPAIRQQICNTKEDTYGDPNYNNRDKAWNTTEKHYGVRNPFQAEEIKMEMVNTHRKNLGVDYPMQSKSVQKKARLSMKQNYGVEYPLQSQQILTQYQQTLKETYGCCNVSQIPSVRRNCQCKYVYNGIMFDSSNEIAYYIFLTDNNINFQYQPNISFKYWFGKEEHAYIPDFFLCDEQKVVEIKGPHFFNDDGTMRNPYCPAKDIERKAKEDALQEAKHQCMIQNNVKIIRTDSEEMLAIMSYISQKYGKDFLCQFKKQRKNK